MLVIAGDIGGTKTNVGLFELGLGGNDDAAGRNAPRLVEAYNYASADYPGLEQIVADFAERIATPARELFAVCFGIAGPVIDNRCKTPNLPWEIDGDALARHFEVPSVVLINDLVATAEGIGALLPHELAVIQRGARDPDPRRPAALIAPGTGLGMAMLFPSDDGEWIGIASEGGHADLAPQGSEEVELYGWLAKRFPDHVSYERVICGPGLKNVYDFLLSRGASEPNAVVRAQIQADPKAAPRLVSTAALAGSCPVCVAALDRFVRLYGAMAGNVALIALATGGVFLAGGISPKIRQKIEDGVFLEAFRSKGRFRGLMESLPVRLILNPDTAMFGAARHAARAAGRRG